MIARLTTLAPVDFVVPVDAEFSIVPYNEGSYTVYEYPPVRTTQPPRNPPFNGLTLDGQQAFIANGLRIDFRKDTFDRSEDGPLDPPIEIVEKCLRALLTRVRFLTDAQQIQIPAALESPWRVEYLADDGSELEFVPGFVRSRFKQAFSISIVAVTPSIWAQQSELDPHFEPPPWRTLLLDARAVMPNVGAAVTLAATALEVFIAQVLDDVAKRSTIPADLWTWINSREWLKQPSNDEQFDTLLLILTGHSLKHDALLWEAFKNIRGARNTFVHEGVPRVGKKPVTEAIAGQLVVRATEIVNTVREWLPEPVRWYQPQAKAEIKLSHSLFPVAPLNQPERGPDDVKAKDEAY